MEQHSNLTWCFDLARIKVAVLDQQKIPDTLEVVFGKYLHGIFFIIEEAGSSGFNKGNNTKKDPMDEDEDLLGEEEKELKEKQNKTKKQYGESQECWS